eukprot:403331187
MSKYSSIIDTQTFNLNSPPSEDTTSISDDRTNSMNDHEIQYYSEGNKIKYLIEYRCNFLKKQVIVNRSNIHDGRRSFWKWLLLNGALLQIKFRFLIAMCMLVFNFFVTIISCYFYQQMCLVAKLGSVQEVAYYFGGGRQIIILVSILTCNVFVSNTIFIIEFTYGIDRSDIVSVLPYQRFSQDQRIVLFFLEISVVAFVFALAVHVDEFRIPEQMRTFSFQPDSGWQNAVQYFRVYFFHSFYLIAFNYLGEQKKVKESGQASIIGALIMLVCTTIYGLSDVPSLKNNPKIYFAYNVWFELGRFTLTLVQIPFKFFVAKESLIIIYDELKNRGLSSKIDDLKLYSNSKAPYSKQMVQKIREDLYQIVRMPFLKFSRKEYIILSTIVYSLTIPPIILMHLWENSSIPLLKFHWELLTLNCSICEPIIIFIVSGHFYNYMCIQYEIDNWTKKLAIGFKWLGVAIVISYTSVAFYRLSNIQLNDSYN